MKFNLLFALFTFLAHRLLPKYDVRMQLLMFQIKMLRDRIDDQRIVPTPEERAGLLRLGNEINHDVADVMLVVKPQTYRRWLSPKTKSRPNIPWSKFVNAHMESLVACDFFTKPVYTLRGKFDAFWNRPGCAASASRRKHRRPTPFANPSSAPANTSV